MSPFYGPSPGELCPLPEPARRAAPDPVPTPVRLAVKRSGGGRVFLTESTGETRVEVALEAAFWRITAPPSRTKR